MKKPKRYLYTLLRRGHAPVSVEQTADVPLPDEWWEYVHEEGAAIHCSVIPDPPKPKKRRAKR